MEHDDHGKSHSQDHRMHIGMFKRRFFLCLALTIPVLLLSEAIQTWFNFTVSIPYQAYILRVLAVIIYVYGGWPFLRGRATKLYCQ